MIFERADFGPELFHDGRAYSCDYEYVRVDKGVLSGSDDGRTWYRLQGRLLLGFDKSPKPSMIMEKPKDRDPFDFLET